MTLLLAGIKVKVAPSGPTHRGCTNVVSNSPTAASGFMLIRCRNIFPDGDTISNIPPLIELFC